MGQPKSVALSCFLYRTVLRLGPSTFRMELQSLLLSDFRHLCLEAHAQAGAEGVFVLLPSHMLHTFCDISGEHFDRVKSWAFKMLEAIYNLLVKYKIITHLYQPTFLEYTREVVIEMSSDEEEKI